MTLKKQQLKVAVLGACLLLGGLAAAQAQQLTEGFEGTYPPTGWIRRNQSTTIGGNTNCWNLFFPPPGTGGNEPWLAHGGNNHTGANFNCTSGDNTISGWFITPNMAALQNGNQLTFWSRAGGSFADRLQARLCLGAADACGAAGSTGATSTDVGTFTTVLLDINPTLLPTGYPTTFTQFSATLAGLPAGPNEGRIAFRYFVTNGGPTGANSNILSIDDVVVTPVELMTFEVD